MGRYLPLQRYCEPMTTFRDLGMEPYNGRTLRRYLEDKHGATFDRQNGSHVHLRLPDGQRVGVLAPSDRITSSLAREIARKLSLTYPDYRAEIGYPIQQRRKGRNITTDRANPVGRNDVIRLLTEIRHELDIIESDISSGDRDPSIYRRAHESLVAGKAEITSFRIEQHVIRTAHQT